MELLSLPFAALSLVCLPSLVIFLGVDLYCAVFAERVLVGLCREVLQSAVNLTWLSRLMVSSSSWVFPLNDRDSGDFVASLVRLPGPYGEFFSFRRYVVWSQLSC